MFKATRKDVFRMFPKVIRVGYCDLQYLLSENDKIAYNAGVYGWNWHCYRLSSDIAVVTGYRNLIGKRCPKVEEFNERAKALFELRDYRDREKKLEQLREEFIEYCKDSYNDWE